MPPCPHKGKPSGGGAVRAMTPLVPLVELISISIYFGTSRIVLVAIINSVISCPGLFYSGMGGSPHKIIKSSSTLGIPP